MTSLDIRPVGRGDLATLLAFIRKLATHEKRPDAVVATEEALADLLYGEPAVAHAFLGYLDDVPVAYAIVGWKFSSFRGIRILYIEDVLVDPAIQGQGLGRRMMQFLAALALDWRCKAMEWSALDYNEEALGFYDYLGAEREQGRLHFDMDLKALQKLAAGR